MLTDNEVTASEALAILGNETSREVASTNCKVVDSTSVVPETQNPMLHAEDEATSLTVSAGFTSSTVYRSSDNTATSTLTVRTGSTTNLTVSKTTTATTATQNLTHMMIGRRSHNYIRRDASIFNCCRTPISCNCNRICNTSIDKKYKNIYKYRNISMNVCGWPASALVTQSSRGSSETDIWPFCVFVDLAVKCLFEPILGRFFGGLTPLNVVRYCRDPQKAHPWPETRVLTYRSSRSVKKCDWARGEESKKRKKEKKKRNSEI